MLEREITLDSRHQAELSLLQRLRSGDAAALEILMEQHASRVYQVAHGSPRMRRTRKRWSKTSS